MKVICLFILAILAISFASASFQVNSLLIKIAVHEGEQVSRTIGISAQDAGLFTLSVKGVPGISLDEQQFVLQAGESKNVQLSFDSIGISPGVYVGSLVVSQGNTSSVVPLIFEVESKDVFIDLNVDIPPQYSTIHPGEKVIAQVKLFDLTSGGTSQGLGPTNVEVEYYVYDIEGNAASSETETVVVDKQTQLTQSLNFPANAKTGQYVFFAIARYKSSVGASSHLFSVEAAPPASSSLFSTDIDLRFFAVLGLIILFFFGMIFFFIYLIKDRDKLILELKEYNVRDLSNQRRILDEQSALLVRKGRLTEKAAKKEVDKKINLIKKKHESRVKELESLKKKGNLKEMERRLNGWKKSGYSTSGLEYRMQGLSTDEMKSILARWKKEYDGRRV